MPTLDAVKNAVKDLDPMEYRQFRDWFEEQDAKAWDQEFEEHVKAGRLDAAAKEALGEFESGACRDL